MSAIKKGMILAAGYGTRLLPITKQIPKPLFPILNYPNILFNLLLLKKHGVQEVIINLHHLQDKVSKTLGDGSEFGLKLSYSHEDELLGTGGGLKNVESFFKNEETFVVCNCDFVTNVDLNSAIDTHKAQKKIATMVLIEDDKLLKKYSGVGTTDEGELCTLGKIKARDPDRQGVFTGIHILNSQAFKYLPTGKSGINETLYPALIQSSRQQTGSYYLNSKEFWLGTGELDSLLESSLFLLSNLKGRCREIGTLLSEKLGIKEIKPNLWAKPNQMENLRHAEIQGPVFLGEKIQLSNCKLGPNVIVGDNARIGRETKIENSIVLPGTQVSENQKIRNAILYETQIIQVN